MRLVIWLILLFVAAVVSASWLGTNDALVSVHWGVWRLDMSLNLVLLALVALVAVLVVGTRSMHSLLALPTRAREWRELKRERAAHQALRLALTELFAARYARAQRWAEQATRLQADAPALAQDHEFAVLAQLLAATSMHRLQDRTGRDAALERVMQWVGEHPGSALDGTRLLAAEWALDDRDAESGQRHLASLPPGVARRTQALRLRLQAARQLRRPAEALQTARLLAKHQGFSQEAGAALLRTLAQETLERALDEQQLRQAWQQLDERERADPWVAACAARVAARLGQPAQGAAWLKPLWQRSAPLQPDERARLALALVDCLPGMGSDWLPLMESSLQQHGREAEVLALVGLVYAERQLWGKARVLLQQAVAMEALPAGQARRALRVLAQVERAAGNEAGAAQFERRAAHLV